MYVLVWVRVSTIFNKKFQNTFNKLPILFIWKEMLVHDQKDDSTDVVQFFCAFVLGHFKEEMGSVEGFSVF